MGKLYDKQLKSLNGKPQEKVFELPDGEGLSIRASLKGKLNWQYRYRWGNKPRRLGLGVYPEMSLGDAREMVKQCQKWLNKNLEPHVQVELEQNQAVEKVTVRQALEYWIDEYAKENRANYLKHQRQFEVHIYPYIGKLPLEEVETRHWLECLDRVRKGVPGKRRPAPTAAGYILGNSKQALRFCRVRNFAHSTVLDDLTVNDVGAKAAKKERYLSIPELTKLLHWCAGDKGNTYYRTLGFLLVCFGARTQEIRESKVQEWNLTERIWTVPASNSKTGKKIIRPIPNKLIPFISELVAAKDSGDWLLGDYKRSEAVSAYATTVEKAIASQEKWNWHDLRRTFATHITDLDIAPHITELLLGHELGGVFSTYNRNTYLKDKLHALDTWVDFIEGLISSIGDNVNEIEIKSQTKGVRYG
ncbi:site-specific integrase [Paraferrimonas sp. SM1919]|uniref:tyrosine-type recombinase/integrase n=1 Tax=Paraferrimonas sp. SM1919 TaxID=2662263 RepID=UPI0013D401AF|nr:site-specific integrase [Paraferrimonas sp. SM1919]